MPQPIGYNPTYISTATTTLVATGPGVLHELTLGETAAGAITLYDGLDAGGTVIGVLKASIVEGPYFRDMTFRTGLTIVTAGASKLTAQWITLGRT